MFVKITNGQIDKFPYTIGDLRKDNPNTSFPKNIPDSLLSEFGLVRVTEAAAPDYDSRTHRLVTQQPTLVDGVWTVTRAVVAKDQAQVDAEAAQKASSVRQQRDKLLAETDWLVIKNLELNQNIPGVWEVYRQALRDIPSQEGFPWNVTWPESP
jgi:hypothetical protein